MIKVSEHLFFQIYEEDINALSEVLVDRVHLHPDLLHQSRAVTTNAKCQSAFLRFLKWASCNGLGRKDTLPAKPLTVALYLSSLIQSSKSPSPVIAAFYAIKWYHEIYGLMSPTMSTLTSNVLESAKRILSKPVSRKEPIDIGLLNDLYDRLYFVQNIKNQRIICAFLLGFAGFLRSSELLKIRVCDIVFQDAYMAIFIE